MYFLAKALHRFSRLNDNGLIKITDFGLTNHFKPTGNIEYTKRIKWMAPEILENEDYSSMCDVVSICMSPSYGNKICSEFCADRLKLFFIALA